MFASLLLLFSLSHNSVLVDHMHIQRTHGKPSMAVTTTTTAVTAADETQPLLLLTGSRHGSLRGGSRYTSFGGCGDIDDTTGAGAGSILSNPNGGPDSDIVLVDFDPKGDPDNPLTWPAPYKWSIVLLLAFMAFTVYVFFFF